MIVFGKQFSFHTNHNETFSAEIMFDQTKQKRLI